LFLYEVSKNIKIMPINKLKEIAAYKAKIAALEKAVAAEQQKKLVNLHKKAGFESTEALITALKNLKKTPSEIASIRRRRRAKITAAMKAEVGKAVKAGKKGAEIARRFSISIPSIQNIKTELGLVKKRAVKNVAGKAVRKVAKKTARKTAKKAARKTAKK